MKTGKNRMLVRCVKPTLSVSIVGDTGTGVEPLVQAWYRRRFTDEHQNFDQIRESCGTLLNLEQFSE